MTKLFSKQTVWVFEGGQSLDSTTEYELIRIYVGLKGKVVDVKEDGLCVFRSSSLGVDILVRQEDLHSPLDVEFMKS